MKWLNKLKNKFKKPKVKITTLQGAVDSITLPNPMYIGQKIIITINSKQIKPVQVFGAHDAVEIVADYDFHVKIYEPPPTPDEIFKDLLKK